MKDATLSSVFAEVERTSRYAFIYTDDVRPLLDRRVSVSVRSATCLLYTSLVPAGEQVVVQCRTDAADVQRPGGAGREAHPNWSFHSCIL